MNTNKQKRVEMAIGSIIDLLPMKSDQPTFMDYRTIVDAMSGIPRMCPSNTAGRKTLNGMMDDIEAGLLDLEVRAQRCNDRLRRGSIERPGKNNIRRLRKVPVEINGAEFAVYKVMESDNAEYDLEFFKTCLPRGHWPATGLVVAAFRVPCRLMECKLGARLSDVQARMTSTGELADAMRDEGRLAGPVDAEQQLLGHDNLDR